MLKYKGKYQVTHQYYTKEDGGYGFSENPDDNYIELRNNGKIYRYDKDKLVVNLVYATPIKTNSTLIKSPLKEIRELVKDNIEVLDEDLFDDCIKLRFYEKDLSKVLELLGNKHGVYHGRRNRHPKSARNLPDFEERRKKMETIKHPKLHKRLLDTMEEIATKEGTKPMILWKRLYSEFKKKHGIDIGKLSDIEGVKPIHIIDSKNYYSKLFEILGR